MEQTLEMKMKPNWEQIRNSQAFNELAVEQLQKLKAELLKNSEFNAEYERLKPLLELKRTIIQARIKANLTQAQIAKAMNVSQSVVARFESGDKDFKFSTLHSYAKAVGVKRLVIEF